MKDIVAGHQISFRFRDNYNKPTGDKLVIHREGDMAIIEVLTPFPLRGGAVADGSHVIGSDTCNNVTKWLEAVHAFLTLDIPTLDTIKEEGNREAAEKVAGPARVGQSPGVIT